MKARLAGKERIDERILDAKVGQSWRESTALLEKVEQKKVQTGHRRFQVIR